MVEIAKWEVHVVKNPDFQESNDENLSWKVINKIRFKSDDPADWGEFRAYGGQWTRVLNRTHHARDMLSDAPPALNPAQKNQPRKTETKIQLETATYLPFWGLTLGPAKESGRSWRLGDDQHMEIFYAQPIPGVPRSDPRSKNFLSDDDNTPDTPAPYDSDLAGLGTEWHIIARDEPSSGPFQQGDFVEYWHRGEFQVRIPKTATVLPQRQQIYLRVNGTFPNWQYVQAIDETIAGMPPSWELSIRSQENGRRVVEFPAREMKWFES